MDVILSHEEMNMYTHLFYLIVKIRIDLARVIWYDNSAGNGYIQRRCIILATGGTLNNKRLFRSRIHPIWPGKYIPFHCNKIHRAFILSQNSGAKLTPTILGHTF